MRVVTCLPRLLAYADRFRMLCALSRKLECLHVLTTDEPTALSDLLSAHPNIRVVILPRKRFNRLAFDWVSERLRAKKLDIIHDKFGHFAPVFQAWGGSRSREYRFISTLYTNNWAWFKRVRSPHLDFGWSYIGQRIITLWRDRRICQHADRVLVLGPGHEDDLLDGHNLDTSRVRWVESEVNVVVQWHLTRKSDGKFGNRERSIGELQNLIRVVHTNGPRLAKLNIVPNKPRFIENAVGDDGLRIGEVPLRKKRTGQPKFDVLRQCMNSTNIHLIHLHSRRVG